MSFSGYGHPDLVIDNIFQVTFTAKQARLLDSHSVSSSSVARSARMPTLADSPAASSSSSVSASSSSLSDSSSLSSSISSRGGGLQHSKSRLSVRTRAVDTLTLEQFRDRAAQDPDIRHFFGMFAYLRESMFAAAMQRERVDSLTGITAPVTEMEGWLQKESPGYLYNVTKRRWFEVRGGFLAYYKRPPRSAATAHSSSSSSSRSKKASSTLPPNGNEDSDDYRRSQHCTRRPIKVICLQAVVVVSHEREALDFTLLADGWRRRFIAPTSLEKARWINALRTNITHTEGHRFHSFAPRRDGNAVEWLLRGDEYYADLADRLLEAKHRIFIAGWWIAPDTFLKRPAADKWKLGNILANRSKQGVVIYLLMWRETQVGVELGSSECKQRFESLGTNIHVLRHPTISPLLWSHHQKCVIIDDELVYTGGLDLCFMRYDTREHRLSDNGFDSPLASSADQSPSTPRTPEYPASYHHPGKDYGNLLISVRRTGDPREDQFDRTQFHRLPWHDGTHSIEFSSQSALTNAAASSSSTHSWTRGSGLCVQLYTALEPRQARQQLGAQALHHGLPVEYRLGFGSRILIAHQPPAAITIDRVSHGEQLESLGHHVGICFVLVTRELSVNFNQHRSGIVELHVQLSSRSFGH